MASVVNLTGIEDSILTFLNANNTSAGATVRDLSLSMTSRVNRIVDYDPSLIYPQPSYFPAVCAFIDEKTILTDQGTIAKDQLTAKRRAELSLKVIGMVWNSNIQTDISDPASKDIKKLMENIEYIFRGYSLLSGTVSWQSPVDCTYHNVSLGEETHLRAGVLTFKAKVDY